MSELKECPQCGKEMRWTENDIESYLFCSNCNLYIRPEGADELTRTSLQAFPVGNREWMLKRLHPEKIFVKELKKFSDMPEDLAYFSSALAILDEVTDDSWCLGKAIREYYKCYPNAKPEVAYLIKDKILWRYYFPVEIDERSEE